MTIFDDIRLLRVTYLRGPNLWTYRSALEVWLDLGELEKHPSDKLAGFVERLDFFPVARGRSAVCFARVTKLCKLSRPGRN